MDFSISDDISQKTQGKIITRPKVPVLFMKYFRNKEILLTFYVWAMHNPRSIQMRGEVVQTRVNPNLDSDSTIY